MLLRDLALKDWRIEEYYGTPFDLAAIGIVEHY